MIAKAKVQDADKDLQMFEKGPLSFTEVDEIQSRLNSGTVEASKETCMSGKYFAPAGGHPPQQQLLTDRAIFKEAYAVMPKGTMQDIVTSFLPFWNDTRLWVLARPLSGFAETFSQYLMDVAPGGGSDRPELDEKVEGAIFVVSGGGTLRVDETDYVLRPGSFAFLPAGAAWALKNSGQENFKFHWFRKQYEAVDGIDHPDVIVTHEDDVAPFSMPDTADNWSVKRFVDLDDMRHDMHINVVTFEPGAVIPFLETHVMEHGLYVLEGKAVYRLNGDWVEVEAGDYMWLRAFCPQACYAGGPGKFRYLLYKNVNRHMPL